MSNVYVTIWSRHPKNDFWVIERSHTWEYAKTLLNTLQIGEEVEIGGRIYAMFKENTNPNK